MKEYVENLLHLKEAGAPSGVTSKPRPDLATYLSQAMGRNVYSILPAYERYDYFS